jgi:uncharacterized protein (UPF0333 family)
MIQKNKAQAMAEFIILIPIFILFLFGIWQFSLLAITKMKLAILEREIIMYVTSDIEKEDNPEEFIRNYTKLIGLDFNKLTIEYEGIKNMYSDNIITKFFNKFKDIRIKIKYKTKLLPFFSIIYGKEFITLATDIYTAHGGSFTLTVDDILKTMKDFFKMLGIELPF